MISPLRVFIHTPPTCSYISMLSHLHSSLSHWTNQRSNKCCNSLGGPSVTSYVLKSVKQCFSLCRCQTRRLISVSLQLQLSQGIDCVESTSTHTADRVKIIDASWRDRFTPFQHEWCVLSKWNSVHLECFLNEFTLLRSDEFQSAWDE